LPIFLGNEQVITVNCSGESEQVPTNIFLHFLPTFANEVIMDLSENLKRKLSKATAMQKRRKESSTKKNYAGIIEKLKNWLIENYPEAVDERNEIILPLPVDIILCFFGDVVDKHASDNATIVLDGNTVNGNDDELDDAIEDEDYQSLPRVAQVAVSTIGSYRSALKHLYEERKIEWTPALASELKAFQGGHKRTVQKLKKQGIMSMQEGKAAISFNGYRLLTEKFRKIRPRGRFGDWKSGIMGWCFNTLQWNLCARSKSIAEIATTNLHWKGDCLIVEWPEHKGDKEGSNAFGLCQPLGPRHMSDTCTCHLYIYAKSDAREACLLFLGIQS